MDVKKILLILKVPCILLAFLSILSSEVALAQDIKVTGTVRDSLDILTGVSVTVKGTRTGTLSDNNGNFVLDVPPNAVLVFSMVGYVPQEIKVSGANIGNVIMNGDDASLDEVVVVGFGTQKKTDMVGSVTTIRPSDLKVPSSNLTTALAGRAAGVIAYQRSGEPGQDNADFF